MTTISSVGCAVVLSSLCLYSQTINNHNLTQPSPAPAQPAANPNVQAQHQNVLPAGTEVSLRLVDGIDSSHGGAGGQYRALVTQPLNVNGISVPRNAEARVVLVQGPGGWAAQLASLTIDGESVPVTSNSATITSQPSAVANAEKKIGSVLGGFGRKNPVPAAVTAAATGQHVLLPPGTELRFVLSGSPASTAPAGLAPTAASPAPADATAQPAAATAASSSGHTSNSDAATNARPGAVEMFCHGATTQTTPVTDYVSGIISWSSADPSHDSTYAWSQYLAKTYPGVRFDSRVQCVGPSVLGIQQDRAQYISRSKFRIVNVDWKP